MPADMNDRLANANATWLRWLTSPLPVSWHLGALVASVALPAVFLGAILINQQHQAELATIERDAMARAQAISYAGDAAVISIISTLRAIGNQPAFATVDHSSFVRQASRSFNDTGIIVTLRDNDLKLLTSTQDTAAGLDLAVDDAVLAREALRSNAPKVSDFSIASGTATPVVHVWMPRRGEEHPAQELPLPRRTERSHRHPVDDSRRHPAATRRLVRG